MEIHRAIPLAIGGLYLLSYMAGILSVSTIVDEPNFLSHSAAHTGKVYRAIIFQVVLGICYIGIGILFYPIIKLHSKSLASTFLSLRVISMALVFLGAVILFMILKTSHEFINWQGTSPAELIQRGNKLKLQRDFINHVAMIIVLCISNMLLYNLLIKSGIIPNWLLIWGIIGAGISIIASMLVGFKQLEIISPTYIAMNVPVAIQELFFAIWLLFKLN